MEIPAGVIVKVADCVTEPNVAEMVEVVEAETAVVLTVNVPVVAPAATVTVAGTVALEDVDASFTLSPPVGAAPLIVTVPVEDAPP